MPLLPVKLFPSRQMPAIGVTYTMPNTAPRVIEQEVTSKIEGAIARIPGIRRIDSESRNGGGWVSIELDRHADIDALRFEVSSAVRQLWPSLPEGLSYPHVTTRHSKDESTEPFISYTVTSPKSPIAIQQYIEDNIKPRLADIDGVEKIDIHGATPMRWLLEFSPRTLALHGVTTDDISHAISRHYSNESLGDITVGDKMMTATLTLPGDMAIFDLDGVTVRSRSGQMIPIDRLVKVSHVPDTPDRYFRINGQNSIYLNVTATPTANQLELSRKVRATVGQLRPSLPDGMRLIVTNDTTDSIRDELNKIYYRTGLTILIILLFIVLTTLNARYTLLILISLIINIGVAAVLWWMCSIELQLYSLAGITISLNLIIDNIIVMADTYRRTHSLRGFTAILAATLTTIGALCVVFFLDEQSRLNLADFVLIVIINLAVSLAVALFLVPALVTRLSIKSGHGYRRNSYRLRSTVWRGYGHVARSTVRFRWIMIVLIVIAIGGSGYLFFSNVTDGHYYDSDRHETVLHINATLPHGATLDQMNELIKKMEAYLSESSEIRQFQTSVNDANHASIAVRFTREAEKTGYPYQLKSEVISKALTLGGGSWSVYGLEDNGFSNDVKETAGSYRIKMLGYNYDRLQQYALALKDSLMHNRRIRDVEIRHVFSYWKEDYTEYYLDIDKERLAHHDMTVSDFFNAVSPVFGNDTYCGNIINGNFGERIILTSDKSQVDVWQLMNMPVIHNNQQFKISDFATMQRRVAPQSIAKENQSYRLCLQYEYIGTYKQGEKYMDKTVRKFEKLLPMGYSVKQESYNHTWGSDNYSKYWLLGLVAAIIFVISAILFNSLRQPLVIISIIPISFIGTFLTFYLFELKFDQGGFASFILLSGITVNAAIYIINEYNNRRSRYPTKQQYTLFMQSVRLKSTPIMLTILSTVLGFIPFIVGTAKENFWFPLAVGTIGGLLFSVVAITLFLPILMLPRHHCMSKK